MRGGKNCHGPLGCLGNRRHAGPREGNRKTARQERVPGVRHRQAALRGHGRRRGDAAAGHHLGRVGQVLRVGGAEPGRATRLPPSASPDRSATTPDRNRRPPRSTPRASRPAGTRGWWHTTSCASSALTLRPAITRWAPGRRSWPWRLSLPAARSGRSAGRTPLPSFVTGSGEEPLLADRLARPKAAAPSPGPDRESTPARSRLPLPLLAHGSGHHVARAGAGTSSGAARAIERCAPLRLIVTIKAEGV